MSAINLCRLCVKVCTGNTSSLYDESGQRSIIHEIALKYFHSMFLNVNQENSGIAVLCTECCHHIADFYIFQQTVFEAQGKLLEGKLDIEFTKKIFEKATLDDKANAYINIKQLDYKSLPDLQHAKKHENRHNDVASQTNKKPSNCVEAEEFGDTKQDIILNRSHSAQPGGQIDSTSATSDWETEYESDDHLLKNAMKRKRKQRSVRKDLSGVIAQWKPRLQCAVGKRSLRNFKSLSKHFHNEHPTEKCHVKCCHRRFYLRGEIQEHARLHFKPNAFKCEAGESCIVSRHPLCDHLPTCCRKKRA